MAQKVRTVFYILFVVFLASCMTDEKAKPRNSREPMPTPDPGKDQQYINNRMEQIRQSGGLGLGPVSESCTKYESVAEVLISAMAGCNTTYILRLKFECKLEIGLPEPFMRPLRYSEVEIDMVSVPDTLKKFFPKKLTTNSDGIVETSFVLKESLEAPKFLIKKNGHSREVNLDLVSSPIVLDERQCANSKK